MNTMKKRVLILTTLLLTMFLISTISAEKIGIDIKNNFVEKQDLEFTITLYDDSNNPIDGRIDFTITNPYSEIIHQATASSKEKINYQLSENSDKGTWEISSTFKEITSKENFILNEIKKVDIKLEQDFLIITNIGNTMYDKDILIKIGNQDQTARVFLDIGQTKKIRLTAPAGEYTITVNDGSQEQDLVFSNVPLTGNVVGLERVFEGNFWQKYPMVSLFLSVILLLIIVITTLKLYKKFSKK